MATEKNFEYLGQSFQLQLLNQIVVDKDFAHSIADVIEPKYKTNKFNYLDSTSIEIAINKSTENFNIIYKP